MILTEEIEAKILNAIREHPDRELILPDFAYNQWGRVVITHDDLPIELHRYLYELLIGPLAYHEQMHNEGNDPKNVNPHLFTVVEGRKSPATHCRKGHPYEGNEAPPNSSHIRCRTCFKEWRQRIRRRRNPEGVPANGDRTHCPQGHEYTRKNTLIEGRGRRRRRRCRTCRQEQAARRRAHQKKEQS